MPLDQSQKPTRTAQSWRHGSGRATIRPASRVWAWQAAGLPVCFTIDAVPNVHMLCLPEAQAEVERRLGGLTEVQGLLADRPAGGRGS